MRKRDVPILFTLGIAAVFLLGATLQAEATLVCKKFKPSGPKVCWNASTGSVNCNAFVQGLAAKLAKDCSGDVNDENCYVEITCSIFGKSGVDCEDFPLGEDACYIYGIGVCENPNGYYNPNGTAFNLPGPMTEYFADTTCVKGGNCAATATVDPEGNGGVCNRNWDLIFTPTEFLGELGFCPGGFSKQMILYSDGNYGLECCANSKRKGNACFTPFQVGEDTEGEPGYIRVDCELPQECYQNPDACFDENGRILPDISYDCSEL
jgi:hypothetical protein